MPIHDWTRVEAGIFHDFHHAWIEQIRRVLNGGLLPPDYYAMVEQQAAGFQPDILTLGKLRPPGPGDEANGPVAGMPADDNPGGANGGLLVAEPRVSIQAETDLELYRRKQNVVAVRHVSGDPLVAVIEIVSAGNKSGRRVFSELIGKADALLGYGVHLLIVDLQPPTPRDPNGFHGALWRRLTDQRYARPPSKPLTLAAYQANGGTKAYVEPVAVGDTLIDMPLFLLPGRYVAVPLEATYREAFAVLPRPWRTVLGEG